MQNVQNEFFQETAADEYGLCVRDETKNKSTTAEKHKRQLEKIKF